MKSWLLSHAVTVAGIIISIVFWMSLIGFLENSKVLDFFKELN